jgi:hypothetical protein
LTGALSFQARPGYPEAAEEVVMAENIAQWSAAQKIGETLRRSLPRLGPEARQQLESFLSPQALAVMGAVLVAWVASHFFGVGEVIDIILVVVGAFAIGLAVFDGVDHLFEFASGALNAKSEDDLEKASKHFAEAVAILGIQAVLAVLFRNRPASYKGGRANVGAPPVQPGGLIARPGLTSTRGMPAGAGVTDSWGKIIISRLGSAADRRLAALHENVHRLLTPRLRILRQFRVRNRASSYGRSSLSKYLEEAVAESVAQVGVNGFLSVFRGISFPVREGYVTLIRVSNTARPFLPELGGLTVGGFLIGDMAFEIWWSPQEPREAPGQP